MFLKGQTLSSKNSDFGVIWSDIPVFHHIFLSFKPLLKIKTIKKNNRQRSCQVMETSGFGFCSRKPSKGTRYKCLIKAQKLAVLVLSQNKVKEPETKFLVSHENVSFWFLKP